LDPARRGQRRARLASDHDVAIDGDSFFLMSVVHSIDHYCASFSTDPIDLRAPLLQFGGAQWIRALFVPPLHPFLAETRISKARAPWLRDLHARLKMIDADFADAVDYSIRY